MEPEYDEQGNIPGPTNDSPIHSSEQGLINAKKLAWEGFKWAVPGGSIADVFFDQDKRGDLKFTQQPQVHQLAHPAIQLVAQKAGSEFFNTRITPHRPLPSTGAITKNKPVDEKTGADILDNIFKWKRFKNNSITERKRLLESDVTGMVTKDDPIAYGAQEFDKGSIPGLDGQDYALQAVTKGFADPTGEASSKFYNPETGDVLANADPKNVELLKKIGLTDDESRFVLDNYYKIDRDTAAAIENLGSNVDEFEKTREEALPYFLKAWSNVKRKRTPQLDHTTQLKAALPFFNNAKVKEFPEIARIIVEEGIFALGHSKKNLTMLDADVHQIKTNFWTRTVGPNGKKFFEGRDISTPEKLRAAAKEYAKLIKQSNNIVDNAIQQYRFMNQTDISAAELDEFINRLGGGRINQKNMVKQVKGILTEMEEDGFIQTPKSTQKIEKTSIKQEKKDLETAEKKKEQLVKDDASVERRMEEIQKYISTREKTFKGQYPLGLQDEQLHFDAETIVKDMKKNRALRENIQGTIFDKENEAAQIEAIKKILWERTGRSRNK